MRWIYISPHLDDAILSAGGLIYEQVHAGLEVEIWTIMCGFPSEQELSPFAQMLHTRWGISAAAEMIKARREEDLKAAEYVGAKTVHFDFLDCIYRRGKNGDWLYSDVFVPVHADDAELSARVAESISARLKPDDNLVCQLALGAHLDHTVVRRAVELLQRPVLYDEDIPYLFKFPDQLPLKTAGMKKNFQRITETGLKRWQDAISAYESQLSSMFDSPDAMRTEIRQYWAENKGIHLWAFG